MSHWKAHLHPRQYKTVCVVRCFCDLSEEQKGEVIASHSAESQNQSPLKSGRSMKLDSAVLEQTEENLNLNLNRNVLDSPTFESIITFFSTRSPVEYFCGAF